MRLTSGTLFRLLGGSQGLSPQVAPPTTAASVDECEELAYGYLSQALELMHAEQQQAVGRISSGAVPSQDLPTAAKIAQTLFQAYDL